MLVTDTVAVITGGASGIGRATAEAYAEDGATVVVADIDDAKGEATVEDITAAGGTAAFVQADVSKSEDVKAMIEFALDEYGGLDVLFNNAGIAGPSAPLGDFAESDFDSVVDVNLKGVFLGMKHGITAMNADGGGSIINTASVAAESGVVGRSVYAATKAGVAGMTRVAAIEYAEDDIRVNSVLPGIVDTPMVREAHSERSPEMEELVSRHDISEAMPGKGSPEEIAATVLFLGSDAASRITGVSLPVDGGFLARP